MLDIFQKWLLDTPVWLSPAYSGSLRRSLAHLLIVRRSWVAPVYPALVSSWQYIRRSMRKVGKARNTKQIDLHKIFDTMNHCTDWHLLPWRILPKDLSLEKFWNVLTNFFRFYISLEMYKCPANYWTEKFPVELLYIMLSFLLANIAKKSCLYASRRLFVVN